MSKPKEMPTITQLQQGLAVMKLARVQKISDLCGVPMSTLKKIRNKTTTNPRIDTVSKIWGVLQACGE